ncbi:hypothetical protein [Paenibacillus donghaensis]|nr:hypothetical protein [Paenibacillus donghaensis]
MREYLRQNNIQVIDDEARADEEGGERFYLKAPFGPSLEIDAKVVTT